MRVSGFIKAVLMLASLFGFAFLAIGGWELWSAYTFASHATVRSGTFKGYHTVFHETTITDSDGHSRPSRTEEALPMFSYTDAISNTASRSRCWCRGIQRFSRGWATASRCTVENPCLAWWEWPWFYSRWPECAAFPW